MSSLFKKKEFFSKEENEKIVAAIRNAEKCTSGEVRVFVESKCKFIDPLDRAIKIFSKLKMQNTQDRNAVLLYVALKHRKLAVYADSGIHEKVGDQFWKEVVNKILSHFSKENYAEGISQCIKEIGEALQENFPYNKDEDKNELPDEIIFGK
jgi:uncharacterized membrane protein